MTDLVIILAIALGFVAIYYVDDGRIRVAVAAAIAGLAVWRANRTDKESLTAEQKPSPLEHAAETLNEVDDAIADTVDSLPPVTADDVEWADAVRKPK